jgi:phosphoribosylglycinamide formyltransferase-1
MARIAIIASGSGSNAENIANYFKGDAGVHIPLILSNNPDAYVHERAEIDFIVLAGFLLKISQPLLEAYPGRIVNIHPALLPKYGGRGMYGDRVHRAVVEAGEKESGITIHYINEHYDEGDIIFQATCQLLPGDTPEVVAGKVHALEYTYYPEVIGALLKKSEQEDQQYHK